MALAFLEYVPTNERTAFEQKVIQVSNALGINPNWLMIIMYSESRFQNYVINSGGCVGLIQFCPSGGLSLFGLSSAQMASFSRVKQLDYVYQYFKPIAGKVQSLADLYIYNLTPADFPYRNNPNHILGSSVSQSFAQDVARQNYPFDMNKDGLVSVQDVRNYLNQKYASVLGNTANSVNNSKSSLLLILALVFAFSDELGLDFNF